MSTCKFEYYEGVVFFFVFMLSSDDLNGVAKFVCILQAASALRAY